MQDLFSLFAVIIHFSALIFFPIHFIRSFSYTTRQRKKFQIAQLVVEMLLMVLIIFCFILVDMSSFQHEKYFEVFAVITIISVIFYWLNKIDFKSVKHSKLLTLMFVGSLFWLSTFTVIKFGPYLPYVWFPMLGLMAIAPLFFAILCFSEIRHHSMLNPSFSTIKVLLLGLIPLIVIQIIMNLYTPYSWEFIKMFNPENTYV